MSEPTGSEADLQEQQRPIDPRTEEEERVTITQEAPDADTLDQARAVPIDEDDRSRG